MSRICHEYDIKNNAEILENVTKSSFTYKGRQFVTYWNNANPLFDIQHILLVLDLEPKSQLQKYNKFSDKIIKCIWHQNKFGGFILRELINE